MSIPTEITDAWVRENVLDGGLDEILEAGKTTDIPERYPTLWDELLIEFDEQDARREARIAGDENAATAPRDTLLGHFDAHRRERCREALVHDLSL